MSEVVKQTKMIEVPAEALDAYTEGTRLTNLEKYEDAIPFFVQAIEHFRYYPEAYLNLGTCLIYTDKPEAALASFHMAQALNDSWPELEYNIGIAKMALGRLEEAEEHLRKAIQMQPDNKSAHLNIGICYWTRGRNDEASEIFRSIIVKYPDFVEAYINLGALNLDMHNKTYALEMFIEAFDLSDGLPIAAIPLSDLLNELGRSAEAIEKLAYSIEKKPDDVELRRLKIQMLIRTLRFDQAWAEIEEGLVLFPDHPSMLALKGVWYQEYGQTDNMAEAFLEVGKKDKLRIGLFSTVLFGLNYAKPFYDDRAAEIYRIYGNRMAEAWPDLHFFYNRARNPDKKLRIGYVSGDYRTHSVSYFVDGLFKHHDRSLYEPVPLNTHSLGDNRTTYLRSLVGEWHDIWTLADQALARRIVDLDIDILVDLCGHTSSHRLSVFALRAAPIQVNWLGFPNTTGIFNMDYRIVDHITDPVGQKEDLHTETLVRLDRCFICYSPPEMTPEAQPRLSVSDGTIVFGSFNNPAKINHDVVRLWARVLNEIPNARLFLKARQMGNEEGKARYMKLFAEFGAPLDRIDLVGQISTTFDHLTVYNEIDVALDTFPYNGTTTTCEAMVMGVPVITLVGDAHRQRVGKSLLETVGLPEFVANNEDEYVGIAKELAQNPEKLVRLRKTLRNQLLESPLCNQEDFTRAMEQAYRKMWVDFAHSDKFKV